MSYRKSVQKLAVPHEYFEDYYHRLVLRLDSIEGNQIRLRDRLTRKTWFRISSSLWLCTTTEYAVSSGRYESLPPLPKFDPDAQLPFSEEECILHSIDIRIWRRNPWADTPTPESNQRCEGAKRQA